MPKKDKTQKDTPLRDTARIQITLDVLAIVFSVIALVVSLWSNKLSSDANTLAEEANNLASQEFAAKLDIASTDKLITFQGEKEDRFSSVACAYLINLVNFGGVTASITNLWPTAFLRGEEVDLSVALISGSKVVSPIIEPMDMVVLSPDFSKEYTNPLLNKSLYLTDLSQFQKYVLGFPLQVEGKKTYTLAAMVLFKLVSVNPNISGPPRVAFDTARFVELSLIEVEFTLELASGELFSTDKSTCLYIE